MLGFKGCLDEPGEIDSPRESLLAVPGSRICGFGGGDGADGFLGLGMFLVFGLKTAGWGCEVGRFWSIGHG